MQLNDEQRKIVDAPVGPVLVAATAGAGKTTVLVARIAALIDAGTPPERILALTFSVKAAREMNVRLQRLGYGEVRVSTFHSLALQILREELPTISQWRVDDSERYRACIKDAVSFRYMDWKSADVTHLISFIGLCKASGARPDSTKAREIAQRLYARRRTTAREPNLCLQAYETAELIRRERFLLTFDDMVLDASELLADEAVCERWASRWDHVLQDEAQDENHVQHVIAGNLARIHRSYMVVGDPAQSIYHFRGAEPSLLLRFESDWSAYVARIGCNYRCATAIVDVGNRALAAMPATSHLGVKMVAQRTEPGLVEAVQYQDFDEEGDAVTEALLESHESGRPWSEHVVLYRTNAQSRGVEEALLSARVPYVVLGGTNFYDRREVKDLLSYLRLAAGTGSVDDVRRSINTPFRFLGKAFLEGLVECISAGDQVVSDVRQYVLTRSGLQQRQRTSALTWCELIDATGRVIQAGRDSRSAARGTPAEIAARPSTILEHLIGDLRYTDWLTRDEGSESPENNRVSNVRELVRAADRFPTVDELLDYVDDTIARAKRAKTELASSDVVTLCSIHRSKGLEWRNVFVIGCNEKILPHAYADDPEEERRLFYVACTRAADQLRLSCVAEAAVGHRVIELKPSHFLEEAGITVVVRSSEKPT